MAKSGQKMPALSWRDLEVVILIDGWEVDEICEHRHYKHPRKPGKVTLDEKWKAVNTRNPVFTSVLRQAGLKRKEFERLYWRSRSG